MGKGTSCIFISTWNRGPRAAHAHSSPRLSPSPRQQLGKCPAGLRGGAKGPANADRPAFCGGALGKSYCFAPPIPTHTSTPKACVYIFSGNSPGQKSPLTHRLAHPYPFSWLYLPPQFGFLCEKLGFSRIDRKFLKKESGCELLSPSFRASVFCNLMGIVTQRIDLLRYLAFKRLAGCSFCFLIKIRFPYVYIHV